MRSGFGEASDGEDLLQRFVLSSTVSLLQGKALLIVHECLEADCPQPFGFMIEPLAHAAKGSVGRYTVVASSTGNTHFPKSHFLKKDFFTPLPHPAWTEDAPSKSSTSFSILQSRELTKQCRLWSCLPSLHSMWCPSGEGLRYLEPIPRPRDRAAHSRSNEPASDFLRHFLHHHPYSPIDSSGQKRHASAIPRKPVPEADDTTPHTHSKTVPKRPRGSSSRREMADPRGWPTKPEPTPQSTSPGSASRGQHKTNFSKYSPVAAKFLEYAQNETLIRQNPQQAHDACAALLSRTSIELDANSCFPFAQGMLRAIVNHCARIPDWSPQQWITQVEELLEVSKATLTFTTPTYGVWEDTLKAHISALNGDIERADALLRDREWCSKHKRQTIEMMNTVIVSLCRFRPPNEVFKYLEDGIDELPALHLSLSWQAPAMKALSDLFRNDTSLFHLIPGITSSFHPAVFLARKFLLGRRDSSKPIPQTWAKETIEAFLMKPELVRAREIQGIYGTDDLAHRSFMEQNAGPVKEEDRATQINVLEELLGLYPDVDAFSYSSNLFLASARGDVKTAESCFARYSQRAAPTHREVQSLLMAYANVGNLLGLKNAFEQLFPRSLEGLTVNYFRPAFYALSLSPVPQPKAVKYWKERMRRAHLVPDSGVYALILQYYANHGDRNSLTITFREIRRNGVPVNKFVYHNMMTFFARRGEVEPVEILFECAKLDGVTPDLPFYANLMNAHVEAGRWPGLTTIYQFLKTAEVEGGRTIVIENILMKASHLLGVPFSVLEKHLSSLEDLGVTPDAHSYTTLIRAVCDVGDAEAAEKLYWEMADRGAVEPGFLSTPHVFHLLISAYLHRGDVSKVLFFCQEMEDRGIEPTAATISKLLIGVDQLPAAKAGLLESTLTKMVATLRASNMAKGVNGLAVGAALEHIYYPAMRAAKGHGGSKLVKRIYEQVVALGHKPSLAMKIALLENFSRRGKVEHVERLWANIFREACRARKGSTQFGFAVGAKAGQAIRMRFLSHRLCLPFNHYINTLSRAGLHEKIRPAVDLYTQRRFALSPRNYNTLILAYLRAGDPQRAFHLYDQLLWKVRKLNRGRQPRLSHVPPSRSAAGRARRARFIAPQLLDVPLKYPTAQEPNISPLVQLINTGPQRRYWRISWPVKRTLERLVLTLKEGYPIVPLSGRLSLAPKFRQRNLATDSLDLKAANVQLKCLKQFSRAWKTTQTERKRRDENRETETGAREEAMPRRGGEATALEESLET